MEETDNIPEFDNYVIYQTTNGDPVSITGGADYRVITLTDVTTINGYIKQGYYGAPSYTYQLFRNTSTITKIWFPKALYFGAACFNNHSNLTEIHFRNETPPMVESNSFSGLYNSANNTIFCPESAVSAYTEWKNNISNLSS